MGRGSASGEAAPSSVWPRGGPGGTPLQCAPVEHLSATQIDELRGQLTAERTRLLARAGEGDVRLSTEDREPSDLQDRAREERDRSASLAMTRMDRERLDEIEAALTRIEDGSYGICEETDEPIPFGRLRAQPTARYTVEAQELVEAEARAASDEPPAY